MVANGTAGDFNKALTITEENVHVPQQAGIGGFGPVRAQNVYTSPQEPLLPYRLASFVTAILGLSNYGPFVSDIAKPSSHDQPQQGSSSSCIAEFGLSNGCHLPSFFADTYNLAPLYTKTTGTGSDRRHRHPGLGRPGRAGVLLGQHLAHQPHRHLHRRQRRRRPGPGERRLRLGRDRP